MRISTQRPKCGFAYTGARITEKPVMPMLRFHKVYPQSLIRKIAVTAKKCAAVFCLQILFAGVRCFNERFDERNRICLNTQLKQRNFRRKVNPPKHLISVLDSGPSTLDVQKERYLN